ncbi:MAG: Tm-1-like ATP-binding domain-containing protein [Pseudomonadota bacterium]
MGPGPTLETPPHAGALPVGTDGLPRAPARPAGKEKVVVLLVSRDTKSEEAEYLVRKMADLGLHVRVVNTALKHQPRNADFTKLDLMKDSADHAAEQIQKHIEAGARAIVGIGGGVGSWVAMNAMQTAPFGFPKIIISTLPFDPRDFVANSDIIVVPSVADIMGLNPILRAVLRNAAAAVAGLANSPAANILGDSTKPVVGITALGVTSPAATAIIKGLTRRGYETAAFHANGYGGRSYERWVRQKAFSAVIDLTTHEITSLLFGSINATDPKRLCGAADIGIPQVVVPGGLDFLGRGPLQLLDHAERKRAHYQQNVLFTHIRTSVTEMRACATIMAERLNVATAPTRVVVPMLGFSAEGAGGAISDPDSDLAFLSTLRGKLRTDIPIFEVEAPINSEAFASAVLAHFDAVSPISDRMLPAPYASAELG